jgi:sugar phosphate isomerase/epimerase
MRFHGRTRFFVFMYSLSTCWNSHRHTDGRAMLREARELGFDYAELSHGTRISLLPGILEAVDAGEIKISTLHNFCPLPMGVNVAAPNLYQFSSDRPRERENALKHTLKTLEFAERIGAPLVVLHLGSIEMKNYTAKLVELVDQRESPRYQMLCAEVGEALMDRKDKVAERVYELLRQVMAEAAKRGVRLGIENREALEEFPVDRDLPFLFRELDDPVLAYWHDTGHAQIKENLGFLHHVLHLEALSDHLAGFHIHDVQFPGRDHREPGTGMIDFTALKQFVKPEHIKVFEFSPSLSAEEVSRGVAHVKRLWNGV